VQQIRSLLQEACNNYLVRFSSWKQLQAAKNAQLGGRGSMRFQFPHPSTAEMVDHPAAVGADFPFDIWNDFCCWGRI